MPQPGASQIDINFTNFFGLSGDERAQTLLNEMMHCAGFTHPDRRDPDPALGQSCAAPDPDLFDCAMDNGVYFGTPPLRAEICIAGSQSDQSCVGGTMLMLA